MTTCFEECLAFVLNKEAAKGKPFAKGGMSEKKC